MYTYEHKIKYYETDKMGITHHSNYIRFMEEARCEWLEHIGWGYSKCEHMGMISPVLSIKCEYKKTTTFDDVVNIVVKLKKYNGLRIIFAYEMKNCGDIVAIAESEHCFLDEKGAPIRLNRKYPQLNEILMTELEKDNLRENC